MTAFERASLLMDASWLRWREIVFEALETGGTREQVGSRMRAEMQDAIARQITEAVDEALEKARPS